MKGSIVCCLAQLVETEFGADRWRAIVKDAGAERTPGLRLAMSDIDDAIALRLIDSTAHVLGITAEQVADAFGKQWCCVYAPDVYRNYVKRFSSAREMILGLDDLHVSVTEAIPNARPPRFDYHWEDERTLLVTYKSSRGLIDLYVGLARGVGAYFEEKLSVEKLSATQCRIHFTR